MSDDEQKQMLRFGITIEHKTIYHYNGYRYDNLRDALRYAEIDTNRNNESARESV